MLILYAESPEILAKEAEEEVIEERFRLETELLSEKELKSEAA